MSRTPTRDLHAGERHLLAVLSSEIPPMSTGRFVLNVLGCFAVLVAILYGLPLVAAALGVGK